MKKIWMQRLQANEAEMKRKTTDRVDPDRRECPSERGSTMNKMNLASPEAVTVTELVRKTNFAEQFNDRYWRIEHMELVKNERLLKNYTAFKNELKALGRKTEDLDDVLVFTAETEKSCREISVEGRKVCFRKRHVLGYTGSGVHLVRNYDILSRYMAYQQYTSPAYIMVYKAFLGKSKPIVPRLHKDDNYVSPWCGFDCHISARKIEPNMPICEALNCSYVYFYEYDDISSNTVAFPRQILPYAVLRLTRRHAIGMESPFFAVGRDLTFTPVEVKGETRRGFRFTYPQNFKKVKPQKQNIDKQLLIKNSLKEQLLEMRTKGDSRSIPPFLEKSLIGRNENLKPGNEKIKLLTPPTLLKCDTYTINFKGEQFCVSPTVSEKKIHFMNGKVDLFVSSNKAKVDKNAEIEDHVKIRRLPLSMKPFVSVKRLQRNILHRTKHGHEPKLKHEKVAKHEKQSINENKLSHLHVKQNDEFHHENIEMSKGIIDMKRSRSTQNVDKETTSLQNYMENDCRLSGQDKHNTNQTSADRSLNIPKENVKQANELSKECDEGIEKCDQIDTIEILSKVKAIRSNNGQCALNSNHQNTPDIFSFDQSENYLTKTGTSFLKSEMNGKLVAPRCKLKGGRIKSRSKPEEKESKSRLSSQTIYGGRANVRRVSSSANEVEFPKTLVEKASSTNSKGIIFNQNGTHLNTKGQLQHFCEKQMRYGEIEKSCHTGEEKDEEKSKNTAEGNSNFTNSTTPDKMIRSLQTLNHKDQNKMKESVKTKVPKTNITNSQSSPFHEQASIPPGFERNIVKNRKASKCSAATIRNNRIDASCVSDVMTPCVNETMREHPKDIHTNREICKPKTIKDLFKEPLRNQLFEKMKSNPRLDNVNVSFEIQRSSQSGLAKTASPPAGVVAPLQLDCSPTVASAKIPFSPLQNIHAFGFVDAVSSNNSQRKGSLNWGCKTDDKNLETFSKTGLHSQTINENVELSHVSEKDLQHSSKLHPFPIRENPYHTFEKEHISEVLQVDETQINKRRQISKGETLAKPTISSPISHIQKQNLPLPVIQANIDSEMPKPPNIPNLAFDEHLEKNQIPFQTRQSSCNNPKLKISPRDPRFKRDEVGYNPTVGPYSNISDEAQVQSITALTLRNKQEELSVSTNCRLNFPEQNYIQKSTTHQLSEKPNLSIDFKTAEKLQRVLRQHISEVKKHTNPKISKSVISNSSQKLVSKKSHQKEMQKELETCGDKIKGKIKDDENYNLNLLASQTLEKIENQKRVTKDRTKRGSIEGKKIGDKELLSNLSEGRPCMIEQNDNDSQDTIIGGLELSPERVDIMTENQSLTFSESFSKSNCTNNISESPKSEVSYSITERNTDSPILLKNSTCENEAPIYSIHAPNISYGRIGTNENSRTVVKKDSLTETSSSNDDFLSIDKENNSKENLYTDIDEKCEGKNSHHVLKSQRNGNDTVEMESSDSIYVIDSEIVLKNKQFLQDGITLQRIEQENNSIEERNEFIADKCYLKRKQMPEDSKDNIGESETKTVPDSNVFTSIDHFIPEDGELESFDEIETQNLKRVECNTLELKSKTARDINEITNDAGANGINVEDKSEREVVSDEDEYDEPPDLTKECCSNIFGNFHNIGENNFACGQSPRAYRSAIMDSLHDLSFVLKLLNETSVDEGLSECLSSKEDRKVETALLKAGNEKIDKFGSEPSVVLTTDSLEKVTEKESSPVVENENPNSKVTSNIQIAEVKSLEQIEKDKPRSHDLVHQIDVKTEPTGNNDSKQHEMNPNKVDIKEVVTQSLALQSIPTVKAEKEPSLDCTKMSVVENSKQKSHEESPCEEFLNEYRCQSEKQFLCENTKTYENVSAGVKIFGPDLQGKNNIQEKSCIEGQFHLEENVRSSEAVEKEVNNGCQPQPLTVTYTTVTGEISDTTEQGSTFPKSYSSNENEKNQKNLLKDYFCNTQKDSNNTTVSPEIERIPAFTSSDINLISDDMQTAFLRNDTESEILNPSEQDEKDNGDLFQKSESIFPSKNEKTTQTSSKVLNQGYVNQDKRIQDENQTSNIDIEENKNNFSFQKNEKCYVNNTSKITTRDTLTKTIPIAEICKSAETLKNLLEDFSNNCINTAETSQKEHKSFEKMINETDISTPLSGIERTVENQHVDRNDTTSFPETNVRSDSYCISKASCLQQTAAKPSYTQCCVIEENLFIERSIICFPEKLNHTRPIFEEKQKSDSKCIVRLANGKLSTTLHSLEGNGEKPQNDGYILDTDVSSKSVSHPPEINENSSANDCDERYKETDTDFNKTADSLLSNEKSTVDHADKAIPSDRSDVNTIDTDVLSEDKNKMMGEKSTNELESKFRKEHSSELSYPSGVISVKDVKRVTNTEFTTHVSNETHSESFDANINENKVPDMIDSNNVCSQNFLSNTHQGKKMLQTQSFLRTKVASENKEKAGILNRGMKERKNMFDTRLSIQRMRAKLTNPLITNITVAVNDTTTPKNTADKFLQKDVESKTGETAFISLEKAVREEPIPASKDDQNETQQKKFRGKYHPSSSSSLESQNIGVDNTVKDNCKKSDIQNTKHGEKLVHDNDHISDTNKDQKDNPQSKEESKKKDIIPFHTVMRKKKEQYFKYKHGLVKNKFIDYSEFRNELRGKPHTPHDEYQQPNEAVNNMFWKPNNRTFKYHFNRENIQDISVSAHSKIYTSGNLKPVISERGTELYEDTYETETFDDVNTRIHTTFLKGDIPKDSFQQKGQSDIECDSYTPYRHRKFKFQNRRPIVFKHKGGPFYSAGNVRSFGFNHGKSGYFSWRKKYQNGARWFGNERLYITRKGVVQTEEEHKEWKMFKERERIRVQIEDAVKDYRRTFENSSDDVVGDEKVSKYLQSLTDKLDHIQNKRNVMNMPEHQTAPYPEVREDNETDTQLRKEKDDQVEVKRLVSVDNIRDQFEKSLKSNIPNDRNASLVDVLWREHEGRPNHSQVLETLFKEHLLKHLDSVTEKLKSDLFAKLASEQLVSDKANKRQYSETSRKNELVSKLVEKQLNSIRNSHKETCREGQRDMQRKYTDRRQSDDKTVVEHFYESDRPNNRHKPKFASNMSQSPKSRNSTSENRSNHSSSIERLHQFDRHESCKRTRSYYGSRERSRSRSSSPCPRKLNVPYHKRNSDGKTYHTYSSKRRSRSISRSIPRSRSRSQSWDKSGWHYQSSEYQSSDQYSDYNNKKRNNSKSSSHSRTRSRSHSSERRVRKKVRRDLKNRDSRSNLDAESDKRDSSYVSDDDNKLSKDQFDRFYKDAVKSKWDNTTDDEAASCVKSTKHEFTGRNKHSESRNVSRVYNSRDSSDERLKAKRDKCSYERLDKTALKHESISDCDASEEERNYGDEFRKTANWKKFDRANVGIEYKKNFGRYNRGHFRGRNDFTRVRGNFRGRFRGNIKHSRGSWNRFDKPYYHEKGNYRERDRFYDSYDDERTRVTKRHSNKWNENDIEYPDEYNDEGSWDRNRHFKDRYEHTKHRDNPKHRDSKTCDELKYLNEEQSNESEKIYTREEQTFEEDLSSSGLRSLQRSYSEGSDSEIISHSPKPIPTICRR